MVNEYGGGDSLLNISAACINGTKVGRCPSSFGIEGSEKVVSFLFYLLLKCDEGLDDNDQ